MKLFDWMRGARHALAAAPAPPPLIANLREQAAAAEAKRHAEFYAKIIAAGLNARHGRKPVEPCRVFDCRVIVVPPGVDVTFKPAGKR